MAGIEESRIAGLAAARREGQAAAILAALQRMATIDGARPLGPAERIGSLEVRKRADLAVLDARGPDDAGSPCPVTLLDYSGSWRRTTQRAAGERPVRRSPRSQGRVSSRL